MIPPESATKRAILTTGLPGETTRRGVPGERPICAYSRRRCEYEGLACTCLLPGFVGTPPTWASDKLRAELDKLPELDEADKQALLVMACAGIEYSTALREAKAACGVNETSDAARQQGNGGV